jgi:hypothetical protein
MDVRFGLHSGLKSDIATCPESAHKQTYAHCGGWPYLEFGDVMHLGAK